MTFKKLKKAFWLACLLLLFSLLSHASSSAKEDKLDFFDVMEFSADGRVLAASRRGSPIILCYDVATGKILGRSLGHTGSVEAIALTPDGKGMISSGSDDTVRAWDTASGSQLYCIYLNQNTNPEIDKSCIHHLKINRDGSSFAVGAETFLVQIYDVKSGKLIHNVHTDLTIYDLCLSKDGKSLASTARAPATGSYMSVQNSASGEFDWMLLNRLNGEKEFHNGAAGTFICGRGLYGLWISADEKSLISICGLVGACIENRDLLTGKEVQPKIIPSVKGEKMACDAAAFASAVDTIVFSDDINEELRVVNVPTGKVEIKKKLNYKPETLAVSADGKLLALPRMEKDCIEIYELQDMKKVSTLVWKSE